MSLGLAALITLTAALLPETAACNSFTVNGVTFSDELGGFVLERVEGQGTIKDPFVVVERMTSLDGGTLLFRAPAAFGNRIGTVDRIGFALIKVIENGTGHQWTSFELELQSKLGKPSDHTDELSFGQGSDAGRPFTAVGFARVTLIDEPFDRIDYDDGNIPPGEFTVLKLVISQPSFIKQAYLAQRPAAPVAEQTTRPARFQQAAN